MSSRANSLHSGHQVRIIINLLEAAHRSCVVRRSVVILERNVIPRSLPKAISKLVLLRLLGF